MLDNNSGGIFLLPAKGEEQESEVKVLLLLFGRSHSVGEDLWCFPRVGTGWVARQTLLGS